MNYILKYKNLFAVCVIVFFFYKVISGAQAYFSGEKEKVSEQIEELNKGEIAVYKWKKLTTEYNELKEVFLDKDALVFKQFVEETAQGLRVRIMSFRTTRDEKDSYWELSTQLRVHCTYKNLVDFIGTIEERSIGIEKIDVFRNEEEEGVIADLTLLGFTLK